MLTFVVPDVTVQVEVAVTLNPDCESEATVVPPFLCISLAAESHPIPLIPDVCSATNVSPTTHVNVPLSSPPPLAIVEPFL